MAGAERPQEQTINFYRVPIALVATLLTILVTIALFITGFFLNQGSTHLTALEVRTDSRITTLSDKIDAIQSRLQAIETYQSTTRPATQTDHETLVQLLKDAAVRDALVTQMGGIVRDLKVALDSLARDQIAYRAALDRIELELHSQRPAGHK